MKTLSGEISATSCSLRESGQQAVGITLSGSPERAATLKPRAGAQRLPWVASNCDTNPGGVEPGNGVAPTSAFPNGVWERGKSNLGRGN
jgi:hypothetical protein